MKHPNRQRRKLLGYFGGRLLHGVLNLILSTCRFEFIDHGGFRDLSKRGRFILTMWHNRLSLVEPFLRRFASPNAYTAVINSGHEGDIIEGLAKSNQQTRVIRMPQQNKHVALKKMIQALSCNEVVILAADGEKGPRYQAKPGIGFTSRTSCAPVVPFSFAASRFWQLKTWDRMIIPKPFSTITVGIGTPIQVTSSEPNENSEVLTRALLDLDQQTYEAVPAATKQRTL